MKRLSPVTAFLPLRCVALAGLLSLGCAAKAPHLDAPNAADLEMIRALHLSRARLDTLRAEAAGELRRGGRRVRFHADILAAAPDRFFAEFGGFGPGANQVALSGADITLFIPSHAEFYQGSGASDFSALIGVEIPPREWIEVLLGHLPHDLEASERLHRTKGRVTFTRKSRSYTIDTSDGWLLSIESAAPESFTIAFGKPISTSYGRFPSSIAVSRGGDRFTLTFKKVVPNPVIPNDHFLPDVPPHLVPQPLREARFLSRP